jgi:hypothetical protein
VHLSKLSARAGLLAVAAALIAVLVAAPGASAATFEGGPAKLDFKTFISAKKLSFKTVGASPNTKTGGTFELGQGTVTMTEQPSGNLGLGTTASQLQFKLGKKTMTLTAFTIKLTAGKGQFNAVVNKKGKAITLFDIASQGKIGADDKFTTLGLNTSNMQLTKSGAAAVNKAFGLVAPKKGKKDPRVKAKQKVGNISFTADRRLEFGSGQSNTLFDQGFYDQLKNDCDITLAPVGTAQPVTPGDAAPRGGAVLQVIGGVMNARTLSGGINHETTGGTSLDRPAGSAKGPAYHTEITGYEFALDQVPPIIRAYSSAVDNVVAIGTLEGGTVTTALNDTGGSVTINGATLKLSVGAAALLQQQTGCTIAAGSNLATATTTANVK